MSSINNIVKRNGEKVPFDPDKLNKWAEWASEVGVDWSSVVLEACRKCHDGCSTTDLHNSMIAACVDQETTQHLKMAGRLYIGALIKETFGGLGNIPSLQKMYEKMTGLGLWAPMDYSEDELAWFNSFIDHSRDFNTSLTELKQITDKYAIVDRVSKIVYETPQFVYMRMAMGNMEKMPKHRRKDDVVKLYQYLSLKKINAPTPFSINLGTPKKQYASCCVTTTNDTAASLAAADHIAYMMTCASAGIGAHIKTRSRGAKVRQGAIMHLGKLPYYKVAQAAVGANLQSCYDEETEVLTSRGFVPFSKLTDSDYVAQVDDNGDVSFVIPLERQVSDYEGVMYHFKTNRNMGIDLLVTPNHRMAWKQVKKVAPESHSKQHHLNNGWNVKNKNTIIQDAFSIAEAENFQPKRETEFVFGGKAIGNNDELCPLVRFKIAFQADGVSKWAGDFAYIFRFTKERKINRFREIVTQCGFEFTESLQKTGVTSFYVKVGEELQKDFSWLDLRFRSAKWFDAFLREVAQWDGSLSVDTSMDCVTFSTTTESVANIVQSAASLCGAYSALSVIEPRKEQHGTQYHVYISFDRTTTTGRTMQKIATQYSGKVYCVTVPTGLIIVRRNGKTAVCGNSRGGAMTMHYNALDPEILDLLSLKNVQTVEQKRIKDIDYSFGFNEEFARRVAKNEAWMLVDYGDAPELYEAMYDPDQSKFVDLYKQIESNPLVKKEFVNARDIALKALKEGVETGRIYLHRTDELNRHTPFKDKIYSSNLC